VTGASQKADRWCVNMMIDDAMSALSHLVNAIAHWQIVAWDEFKAVEQELAAKYPDGYPADYDPATDEAFVRHHSGLALYGSMAVAIAAKVEDMLPAILRSFGVTDFVRDGKPSKPADKPHFDDYMFALEQKCGCKRVDIAFYGDHLFVRELANRCKHSGGKSTEEFVKRYATVAGVDAPDQDIPFDVYDWKSCITQAGSLLADVAGRLSSTPTDTKETDCE
jgi:hypothetical protein